MDLTQLANLGEFVGGVAVIVTYLAAQAQYARVQRDTQLLSFALQTTNSAIDRSGYLQGRETAANG